MLKHIAIITSLTVSGLALASGDCEPINTWEQRTNRYVELIKEYKEIAADKSISFEEKVEALKDISQEMARTPEGDCYLNDDYNSCMRESNAQHRSDYDRCDRNGGKDSCYDRADRNNDNRRHDCKEVAHSDNATSGASKIFGNDKGGNDRCSGGGGGSKKSSGHISAGDRHR